jgi:hypothetical protein
MASDGPATDSTVEPLDAEPDGAVANPIAADPFTNNGIGGFGSSLAVLHTVGSNPDRLLLVGLSISFAGTTATAVTYDGNALTFVGARNAPSQDGRVELWSLVAPPSGAHTLQITLDDASSTLIAGVGSYAHVDQTTPLGPFLSEAANTNDPTLAVASTIGEVAFGVVMWNGGDYSTLTAGANQQTAWNRSSDNLGGCCSIVGAGAHATQTSPTLTWQVAGNFDDFWATAAVTIRPATP